MPSYQNFQFCGHLGADPEIRYTKAGKPVASFRVAVSDKRKDTGEEETEWLKCSAFGAMAEQIAALKKGALVTCLSGKIKTEKWQNSEGQDVYTTKVLCWLVIGGKWVKAEGGAPQFEAREQPRQDPQKAKPAEPDDFGDEIPF